MDINIEYWDYGKKTAYTCTWDDYCIDSWKKIIKYANKKDIKNSFFINNGYCEAGKFQSNNLITTETPISSDDILFFKKIINEGHEIGGHTMYHEDCRNLTNIELEKDCLDWIQTMKNYNLIKKNQGLSFSYPFGVRPKKLDIIKKYFLGARAHGGGLNLKNPKNIYRLKTVNLGKRTNLQKLNNSLDEAILNEKILIIAGHGINNEGWSPIPENIIFNHFDYVFKKKDNIWITTMINIIKYTIQRNNLSLNWEINDKNIIIKFKKIKFNFDVIPITISFNFKIKSCIQNNKIIPIENNYIRTSDFNHIIKIKL